MKVSKDKDQKQNRQSEYAAAQMYSDSRSNVPDQGLCECYQTIYII